MGDKVKNGEILAEIQTDKATMEFESYFDGVLLYIGVETGKAAPVDAILAIIGKAGEDFSSIITEKDLAHLIPLFQITKTKKWSLLKLSICQKYLTPCKLFVCLSLAIQWQRVELQMA